MSLQNKELSGRDAVSLRFNFYRDGLGLSLLINVILVTLVIFELFYIYKIKTSPPPTAYFSVDGKGAIVPLASMSEPYLSESDVLDFASKAVRQSYTFDAENYRDRINDSAQYFTPEGHKDFVASMQIQIKYVVDNVLIGSAVPSGTAVLVNQGRSPNGIFAWKVKVPVVVTFRTQTSSSSVKRIVTVVVINRPTYETPYGVGISSFIAQDQ